MEINDFRMATEQRKRSRQRCLSYLLKCACCRRGHRADSGSGEGKAGIQTGN